MRTGHIFPKLRSRRRIACLRLAKMKLVRGSALIGLALAAGSACGTFAQNPGAGVTSTPRALYTDEQGDRGAVVFGAACAGCHSEGELSGRLFQIGWQGKSVGALFTLIRTTMPFDRPALLQEHEYADVTAYILRLNGRPARGDELQSSQPLEQVELFPASGLAGSATSDP
ncbi:MAG: hypothetical protein GEU90_20545 [Gemmatimonas sp.]|nr:hypothetical protein [Gemmatimonas sp.]